MDTKKPHTDPRIIRTRHLIRDAFVDLLQEMDIEKISVNSIAERATINRVTFYLHYRDISDMLEKMANDMIENIERILSNATGNTNSAEETDWEMMVCLLEHIAEQAKFYKVILASKRTPIFTERLLKLLTEMMITRIDRAGRDSSISNAGIKKDVAIWYYSSALIGTIVYWLRNDMPYTPLFLARQFSLLLPLSHNKDS